MDRETLSSRLKDNKGTVAVTVAVLFIFLIMFAAFAIDVGYMMVRRNELQNIADTAALAATGQLGSDYQAMDTLYTDVTPDPGPLWAKAQAVVDTMVSGDAIVSGVTITGPNFRLGVWNPSTHTFSLKTKGPTAVNVTARKDNMANGPFSTLLAGVLGIDAFNISATATASLTPLLKLPEGKIPIPVGISYYWYKYKWENGEDPCNQPIMFYPTGTITGCAGWHVYDQSPSSSKKLGDTIDGLASCITGSTDPPCYNSPETTAGATPYNFTGGNIAGQLSNFKNLFDLYKEKDTDSICSDRYPGLADGSSWTAAVAVYDMDNCDNPHDTYTIVGFSTVTICYVKCPECKSPLKGQEVGAVVRCDDVKNGPGGGPIDFGTLGKYPNLVQ